jgi:alkylation response protein AidB-like acyl-CoA dehydrogenase
MDFQFSQQEQKVLEEVRAFLKSEVTPELKSESLSIGYCYGGELGRKFVHKFASNGWLVPNWPEAYGGMGASSMLTFAIKEELAYVLPFIFVAAHMAGPTIMHFGSEKIKNKWLLRIARGEVEFALGYTEPWAGSDLSELKIEAVDQGDHFLLNGQKTFNTHTHVADYHWLAAITDPDAKKYKNMSMMIVDLKTPGITIRPMVTMAGWQTNEVFYDNVKVPKENLVGELNQGFYYLMSALDYERMFPMGGYQRLFDDILQYTKETKVNGQPLAKDPLVRQKMAQLAIELEVNKLIFYRLAHMIDNGKIPNYETSMQKLFATELAQKITNTGMDVLGLYGQLKTGSKWTALQGEVEHHYRWSVVETIYAGTSEIQRNIMALRGLKLPTK